MSHILINQYYNNLDRALQFGKTTNEQSVRNHFWSLLNEYARKQYYEVIAEVFCMGTKGKKVYPDGIVKNLFGLDIGLWESKDEKDNIDDEIDAKLKKGYPFTNILFEDTNVVVLFQRGEEVRRIQVRNPEQLHDIITDFISFKSETVYKFEDALDKFKADIPAIVETLRKRIDETRVVNRKFIEANKIFLEICKVEINPDITDADIREMMIQHILTSDIFNKIFDDSEFHRHNNIARELENLIEILFTYAERKNLIGNIEHYYDAINAAASGITDHHEKQKFLKVLYENFYKVYNPKAADRLGMVYTPNEIVNFMIDSTENLLHKHFNKTLADKNVEILDPATGTGTFITSIIDHLPKQNLIYKYKTEIHANEVAILPYYIANLNIEFTFKQKMGYYEEFNNLCFVDTLDNTDALYFSGRQENMFGLSSENSNRIKRQNSKKISVIIGNPPYNANQGNENENNKNRKYPEIDKRIKATYIYYSKAQKPKSYDMFTRFYRWATDRVNENGIIAFITNRSIIDKKTFDGFRKCIQDDFANAYVVDLGGDIRDNMGSGNSIGNVFGIITGVAIIILIKKRGEEGQCIINYTKLDDVWSKETKLDWLKDSKFENIEFVKIEPDKNNRWLDISENDFDSLLQVTDKKNKLSDKIKNNKVIFRYYSNGCVTNRDEWVYDHDRKTLENKIKYFLTEYNNVVKAWKKESNSGKYINKKPDELIDLSRTFVFNNNPTIKWSGRLFRDKLLKGRKGEYNGNYIRTCMYRPFVKTLLYYDYIPIDIQGQLQTFFPKENSLNVIINYSVNGKDFHCLCTDIIVDLHLTGDSGCFPLYYYDGEGNRNDNITNWSLEKFIAHYGDKKIKKDDIFHYFYSILHNPKYRNKYTLNLKRETPRIPFYEDFWKWANIGKKLMELHINYETINAYPLKLHTSKVKAEIKRQKEMFPPIEEPHVLYALQPKIKVILKADKEKGIIEIDELTFLSGVPKEAWEYKLGNRSAIEWVLNQYKEKKPDDPTVAEKFNCYHFMDHKNHVIDLIKRVCTVSVNTMEIISEMEKLNG